ncbi:MAG: manganese efflux pump [Paenibacillaceae bacterium]
MSIIASQWGQFATLFLMAFALGLDAFSLGLGIGMKGIRLLDILKISIVIALFHIFMPLFGFFMGNYLGLLLGGVANTVGGILLVLLGSHMVYSAICGDAVKSFDYRTMWGLLLFSFMVSIDAFSVGVSLGMFATDLLLAVLLFGLFGGGMSIVGLLLGRKIGSWVGGYGEAFGGAILFMFGIKFLF